MKKKQLLITYILLFISFPFFAQDESISYTIDYEYFLEMNGSPSTYIVNSTLIGDNNTSLYEIDHVNSSYNKNEESGSETGGTIISIKSTKNDYVYKSFKNGDLYYRDRIGLKKFYIKDSLNQLGWVLGEETKKILGYECQEAKLHYKGRDYVAFFTTDIPISDGPWRFYGLPGIILHIESNDGVFKLSAKSLSIKEDKIFIENPFINENTLTWNEFLKLYEKKYKQVIKNSMTEYGPTQVLSKKGIVEYIVD